MFKRIKTEGLIWYSYSKKKRSNKKRSLLSNYFAERLSEARLEEAKEEDKRRRFEEKKLMEASIRRKKKLEIKREKSRLLMLKKKRLKEERLELERERERQSKDPNFSNGYDLRKIGDTIRGIKNSSEVTSDLLNAGLEADKLDWEKEKREYKDDNIYKSNLLSKSPLIWDRLLKTYGLEKKVEFKKKNVKVLMEIIRREISPPKVKVERPIWNKDLKWLERFNSFYKLNYLKLIINVKKNNIMLWCNWLIFECSKYLDIGVGLNIFNISKVLIEDLESDLNSRLFYFLRWISDYDAEIDVLLYYFEVDDYLYLLGEYLRCNFKKLRTGISILASLIMYINLLKKEKDRLNIELIERSEIHLLCVDIELWEILSRIRKEMSYFRKYLFFLYKES